MSESAPPFLLQFGAVTTSANSLRTCDICTGETEAQQGSVKQAVSMQLTSIDPEGDILILFDDLVFHEAALKLLFDEIRYQPGGATDYNL